MCFGWRIPGDSGGVIRLPSWSSATFVDTVMVTRCEVGESEAPS